DCDSADRVEVVQEIATELQGHGYRPFGLLPVGPVTNICSSPSFVERQAGRPRTTERTSRANPESAHAGKIQARHCPARTLSDRMRSVHAVPNLAKSLIVVARKAFRPLQQARLCCKDSFHSTDLLAVSERAAEVNLHACERKPRLRRFSTTGFV